MKRKAFRYFTFVLFVVCVWAIFANVLSDDTEVRKLAEQVTREKAGCGDKCKVVGIHGTRGMIDLTATYDIGGVGQYVTTCRRKLIIAGDYACVAEKP